MRSHSVLLAIVVAALCLSLVTADWTAKLKAQPVKHAKAHAHHHKHHATKPPPQLNLRPIIGIFTDANSDNLNETGSKIPADYVKWLEQAGARVAVVPFNAPHDVLDALFDGINGLLFTGGGLSLNASSLYFQQATYLFNLAMAANDAGDFFPIWGTCQGFQMMHLLAAQPADHSTILKCEIYNSTNLPLSLNFTDEAPLSQLYGPAQIIPAVWDGQSMHPTIYETLATQQITMNLHNCGVNPADFWANPILPKFYRLLSTNVDLNGLPFVSSIEGIQYPFWATQYHPERTQFEWDLDERLVKTAPSIAVHSYLSQRWMMLARQSQHKFPTVEAETAALIYAFNVTYTGGEPLADFPNQQVYELNFEY